MTFPNFRGKHLEEALFHPNNFIDYTEISRVGLPTNYILVWDKKLTNRAIRKYKLEQEPRLNRVFHHAGAYVRGNIGLIRFRGIGSPNAVAVFEELIALGGKRFISLGTAGGLLEEGVFLCDRAIRDEGTSSHYSAHSKYSYPDEKLTEALGIHLRKVGVDFRTATTWTIDAPYRETKAEIETYKREGVATVEMEASALYAVAKLRKVKIASVFAVSDVLGKKWEPKFHHINLRRSLDKISEAAFSCLS